MVKKRHDDLVDLAYAAPPGTAVSHAADDPFRPVLWHPQGAAVERGFAHRHRVADYARELGYAPRTLTRATQAAAGVGAKEFIDRRMMLEAQRLLAHSELPAVRVAEHLGFEDAANFSKFFQHRAGVSPGAFRAALRRHDTG